MLGKIEEAICLGVRAAHKKYEDLSAGSWLHHAPESFLSTMIGLYIYKYTHHNVYLDTGLRRIATERSELGLPKRVGRPPLIPGYRPDISVWAKTGSKIIAAIEVKRSNGFSLVDSDVEKLGEIVGKPFGPKRAYVLAYTTATKENTIKRRFDSWARDCTIVHCETKGPRGEKWRWGFALLRTKSHLGAH